jgi:hypothetical protein
VIVDHRPKLDLLDLDDFLLLACLSRFLLRLVLVFAVIQDLADGRGRVGGDLDEIKPGFLGFFQSKPGIDRTQILANLIDQLNFAGSDFLVDARTVLLDGLRSSNRTTNGYALLCCCDMPVVAGA